MLKKRLVACVVIKAGIVVQSIGFKRYLPVGSPEVTVEFLSRWGVDEIVLLDMDATVIGREPDYQLVGRVSRNCRVPLTVGGGIKEVRHIEHLLHSGADKVSLNYALIDRPDLVDEGARVFGDQCIVASIDARKCRDGYEVCTCSGSLCPGIDPVSLGREVASRGAGEILINSIDRDGTKQGYDMDLVDIMTGAVSIPLIICGGVGRPEHFEPAARRKGVNAVAAANFFHFSEHSVNVAKHYLRSCGENFRIDAYASYDGFGFDSIGRIDKQSDEYLEALRFNYYPDEVI